MFLQRAAGTRRRARVRAGRALTRARAHARGWRGRRPGRRKGGEASGAEVAAAAAEGGRWQGPQCVGPGWHLKAAGPGPGTGDREQGGDATRAPRLAQRALPHGHWTVAGGRGGRWLVGGKVGGAGRRGGRAQVGQVTGAGDTPGRPGPQPNHSPSSASWGAGGMLGSEVERRWGTPKQETRSGFF